MSVKHEIRDNEIFVFGSNKAGKHGLGTALMARMKYGAQMGQGYGLSGNSFAVPVKDEALKLLPLEEIAGYVQIFLDFAKSNFNKRFFVTPLGTALGEYHAADIAPLFKDAPDNCRLPPEWEEELGR